MKVLFCTSQRKTRNLEKSVSKELNLLLNTFSHIGLGFNTTYTLAQDFWHLYSSKFTSVWVPTLLSPGVRTIRLWQFKPFSWNFCRAAESLDKPHRNSYLPAYLLQHISMKIEDDLRKATDPREPEAEIARRNAERRLFGSTGTQSDRIRQEMQRYASMRDPVLRYVRPQPRFYVWPQFCTTIGPKWNTMWTQWWMLS